MSLSRDTQQFQHRLEYKAAKMRIDQALDTLKKELKSMRDQDVALLKQLIKINETIRKLARGRCNPKPNQRRSFYIGSSTVQSEAAEAGKARLVRQLSEPHDCGIIQEEYDPLGSSIGSLEDGIGSVDDFSFSSGSELEDSTSSLRDVKFSVRPISRPRSISFLTSSGKKDADSPTTNNTVYEEILRRNIVLWKHRLTENSNDNVFCEHEEENEHDLYSENSVILV